MSNLPEGWSTARLSEVTADTAQHIPAADESFSYIDIGSIDRETKTIANPLVLLGKDAPSRARKKVAKGDTLVSMTRPNLNAVALVPSELDGQIASTGFEVLRPLDGIEPRWLSYLVRTEDFVSAMSNLVQGALYPAVRTKDVRAYEAPIAPVDEQTRIADQLDTLLARINACNDHLDAIPGILKRFRLAVLDAATFGVLTDDWRNSQDGTAIAAELRKAIEADHESAGGHERGNASEPTREAHDLVIEKLPRGWEISTLRDCCRPGRPITYGILKPGPELDEGVPYIRVADFPGNRLRLDSIKKTSPEIDLQFQRARLMGGDLLLSIRGSVGRLIEIPHSLEGANITQDTARLSISKRLQSKYVYYALLSPDSQRRMATAIRGVAVRGINIGDVRALQVPLPSEPEQVEIVRRVEALFALSDRIEARYISMRAHAQRLTPQVLAKAFRGELVQQNPQDEPASVLLQRLAASQPVKVPTSRGRPRAKPLAQPDPPALKPSDWATLPSGEWAAPADPQGQATTVCLSAVLRAWGQPMPEREARLATLLCQQPRIFTNVLPASQAKQWSRLVGDDAKPLPAKVARIQPVANHHWGQAIKRMRASGDLVESGSGDNATWALGPGAVGITTTGWPDGRAAFVVAHLRAHGIASVLPALEPAAQEFVNVRAA